MKHFLSSRTRFLLLASAASLLAACTPVDRTSPAFQTPATGNTYNHVNAPKGSSPSSGASPGSVTLAGDEVVARDVLTGRSLVFLYSNRTSYGKHNARDGDWIEYTAKDGRAIYLNRYGEISDGTWWVTGDKICFSYGSQDTASCNYVRPEGSFMQYEQENGRKEFYATRFVPGDRENLIERAAQIRN